MPLSGQVTNVKIKNDNDSNDIRSFANAKIDISDDNSNPEVLIRLPPDSQDEYKFYLNDCTYLVNSSSPGSIVCIRINSKQETIVILDKNKQCIELLEFIQEYLTERTSSSQREVSEPKVQINLEEKVEQFITALNNGEVDKAAEHARDLALAGKKSSVGFYLDRIGESKKATDNKLLKLQVTIESASDKHNGKSYEVTIRSETSLDDLKQEINEQTGISIHRQHWFLNREPLNNNYVFVDSPQLKNDNTMLFLYVEKA